MKPDATKYNPNPEYLKELIKNAGYTQRSAARQLGLSERVMRQYLASRESSTALEAPYPVQFALECLNEQ